MENETLKKEDKRHIGHAIDAKKRKKKRRMLEIIQYEDGDMESMIYPIKNEFQAYQLYVRMEILRHFFLMNFCERDRVSAEPPISYKTWNESKETNDGYS
jgi:hypothetical protein